MSLSKVLLQILLSVAAILLSWPPAASQAQSAARQTVVSGIVATPAGKPVPGADVGLYLLKPDYEHVAVSTHTHADATGAYTISITTTEATTIEVVKASTPTGIGFEVAGFASSVRVILRPRGDFKIHLRDIGDGGKPVAGVVVHPTWMTCSTESRQSADVVAPDQTPWSPDIAPDFHVTTDADGDAVMHGFPLGVPTGIEIEHSPYVEVGAPGARGLTMLGVAGEANHTLAVWRAGSVSGRVVFAASGKPAADVCVQAYENSMAVEPTVYTDANGRYEIDGLTPNNYMIIPLARNEVEALDNPDPGEWVARGKLVNLSVVQANAGVDFSLERGGLVTGTVTDSDTGSPESVISIGARVAGSPLLSVRPDQSGHYTIRAPAGPAVIVPVADQFDIDEGERRRVNVVEGGTTKIDFFVNPRDDYKTAGGIVLQADGMPAGGAIIFALGEYGGGTTADAEGRFLFSSRGLPPNSELFAQLGGELTPAGTPAFDNVDPAHIVLNLQRDALPTLTGRVLTEEGLPLSGAKVTIARTAGNSGTIYSQLTTDTHGRYTSLGLWPGFSYEADVNVEGYVQKPEPPITPVLGQPLPSHDIVMLKPGTWVAGRVIDAAGRPVKGANVYAGDGATTDADGRFRVNGVMAGSVLLTVTTRTEGGAYAELPSGTSDGIIQLDAPQPRNQRGDNALPFD